MRSLAPGARWFYVGKRACRQSIRQEVLNRLLIKYARRGLRVVRLKCGDPYVFGRGGEEALALARAGIPFEVIPGVSTAVAAPALAGIPVTHRGLASSYAVITGHHEATLRAAAGRVRPRQPDAGGADGDGTARVDRRAAGGARLVAGDAGGRDRRRGDAAELELDRARSASLGAVEVPAASSGAPGLLVIGAVVGLAAELAAGLTADLRGGRGGRS